MVTISNIVANSLIELEMRAIERRKNQKRWYLAKQAFEVIEEITSEW